MRKFTDRTCAAARWGGWLAHRTGVTAVTGPNERKGWAVEPPAPSVVGALLQGLAGLAETDHRAHVARALPVTAVLGPGLPRLPHDVRVVFRVEERAPASLALGRGEVVPLGEIVPAPKGNLSHRHAPSVPRVTVEPTASSETASGDGASRGEK